MSENNGNVSENVENIENVESKPQNTDEKKSSDFKVAEIWIKSGQIQLDATELFWKDKVMSIGILEFCKDIVKNTQFPEPEKPKSKIVTPFPGMNLKNFVNNLRKKR